MIHKHVEDINQDMYCYDTGMTFGQDIATELLAAIDADVEQFPRRVNYNHGTDYKELAKKVGAKRTREIIKRQLQINANYPNQKPIEFSQRFLTPYFREKLLNSVPPWLVISETEPDCMLQISISGDVLPPHKGHHRKCSLFMLLQADGQETRWYRNTEDFEVIDELRIPDLDKIEQVVSTVIEPGRWYMFNNYEWHSVHKFSSTTRRISIGLDFNSVYGDEMVKLIKNNT